jgi:hydroxymethylbilane synthase
MKQSPFRIGSRGSPLALAQAHMVAHALRNAHGWDENQVQICVVVTSGDRIQDRALAEIGGKALWTKELDRALLTREIDCAVHSMKDVETIRPNAIVIAGMLERAAVEDRLIGAPSIDALRKGAVIGTSSPRRSAQLLALRPDLSVTLFRGNVATRLAKLEAGEADATLLAAAGLDRLGQSEVGGTIPIDTMLPAPAQGAVGIECRADDAVAQSLIAAIDHAETSRCVMAERAFLAGLGGTCHSPIAALARLDSDQLWLRGQILSPDGTEAMSGDFRSDENDEDAARTLAEALLRGASPALRALFVGAS